MFQNFGINKDIRHCLLGLIYFTALLSYGAALEASSRKPTTVRQRPAAEACRNLMEDLSPSLTPHILDGPAAFPGEYPFMAALGYSVIGNEGAPYDVRCGGTLINDRFVLTAAQCVENLKPDIVHLGISNFNDPDEQIHRMDVPIKKIHIHPKYSRLDKSNDVALLEFENPVNRSDYIMPTCLYTANVDPSSDAELFVAGWGVVNHTTSEDVSSKLIKTKIDLVSDTFCNAILRNKHVILQPEHLCAIDPKDTGKPCFGDGGGPLFLIVDENTRAFQQVGIISSGIDCSNALPHLYMRVSAYLDYIESIVWP